MSYVENDRTVTRRVSYVEHDWTVLLEHSIAQEKFEDTKGVIRNRKLKDRQDNGQKRHIIVDKTVHRKLE